VHPTSDQLFGGETFDAYQALGRYGGAACAAELAPAGGTGTTRPAADTPGESTRQVRVASTSGGLASGTAAVGDVAAAAAELS
jgi:hypothetical protein